MRKCILLLFLSVSALGANDKKGAEADYLEDETEELDFLTNCEELKDISEKETCIRLQTWSKDAHVENVVRKHQCEALDRGETRVHGRQHFQDLIHGLESTLAKTVHGVLSVKRERINLGELLDDLGRPLLKHVAEVMNRTLGHAFNRQRAVESHCERRKGRKEWHHNHQKEKKEWGRVKERIHRHGTGVGGLLDGLLNIGGGGGKKKGGLLGGLLGRKRRQADDVPALHECMTMACVCNTLTGSSRVPCYYKGVKLTKAIRKEYHMLTDAERTRYHKALNTLYQQGIIHGLALYHYNGSYSGNAHNGPAFFPWHRELLKRVELELRRIDPLVSLPYWYSPLNNFNVNQMSTTLSKSQVTFSSAFMGNGEGVVRTGAPAYWLNIGETNYLTRSIGRSWTYFYSENINIFLNTVNAKSFFKIPQPVKDEWCKENAAAAPIFENFHNAGHNNVGGDMYGTETAGMDPLFYMHHAFVDHLWEIWRNKYQNRTQRETEYMDVGIIERCGSGFHLPRAIMEPFNNLRNIDGLLNSYTDELYEYAAWPTCSTTNRDCGSPNLFCTTAQLWYTPSVYCMAKLMPGGACQYFPDARDNACYNGRCVNGVCVANSMA